MDGIRRGQKQYAAFHATRPWHLSLRLIANTGHRHSGISYREFVRRGQWGQFWIHDRRYRWNLRRKPSIHHSSYLKRLSNVWHHHLQWHDVYPKRHMGERPVQQLPAECGRTRSRIENRRHEDRSKECEL